jgi:hypothetical protein
VPTSVEASKKRSSVKLPRPTAFRLSGPLRQRLPGRRVLVTKNFREVSCYPQSLWVHSSETLLKYIPALRYRQGAKWQFFRP